MYINRKNINFKLPTRRMTVIINLKKKVDYVDGDRHCWINMLPTLL